jgi:hypothetical protein
LWKTTSKICHISHPTLFFPILPLCWHLHLQASWKGQSSTVFHRHNHALVHGLYNSCDTAGRGGV